MPIRGIAYLLSSCWRVAAEAAQAPAQILVPVTCYKLSEDTATSTAVVGVYYNLGFRIEPIDLTGFPRRLRAEPGPESELQGIKNRTSGIFVLQNSSDRGIIDRLALKDLQRLAEEYLRTYIQRANAATSMDL